MTEYRYLTAVEWGMRWARPPVAEKLLDPECYVHHSAGAHPTDAVKAFRALNEYAINVKGYSALDYDVLVHRNPITGQVTIGEGRGRWMSAATLDRNEQGEAVCVLGYFHPGSSLSRPPHPEEVEGTALAIRWGIENRWIAEDARILGHRDNPAHPGATACPGDYLYAQLPTIRARVAELLNPPAPAPLPTPEDDVLSYPKEIALVDAWGPPSVDAVVKGTADRWLAACTARVGAIPDVQRRHGLPVTGLYDGATNAAYVKELAAFYAAKVAAAKAAR